jgi:hypothetical protein
LNVRDSRRDILFDLLFDLLALGRCRFRRGHDLLQNEIREVVRRGDAFAHLAQN